jgi:uncharacterized protein YbaR (Trm112 family)
MTVDLPIPEKERTTKMAISPDLLEILVCPACKAEVLLTPDGGGLRCVSCRRVYPIRNEIPVMMIDEASIDDGGDDGGDGGGRAGRASR